MAALAGGRDLIGQGNGLAGASCGALVVEHARNVGVSVDGASVILGIAVNGCRAVGHDGSLPSVSMPGIRIYPELGSEKIECVRLVACLDVGVSVVGHRAGHFFCGKGVAGGEVGPAGGFG